VKKREVMGNLRISEVGFVQARPGQIKRGLIGHVSLVVDDVLKLDGLVLRKTRRGHHVLSFPCRRDREGRSHPFFRPIDNQARRGIEAAVFDLLDLTSGDREEETP
jgi:DNA-binding cell septation regulator SpoVG